MKPSRFHLSFLFLTVVALVVSACSLGSKKPSSEIVATPSSGDIKLINAFMTYDPALLDKGDLVPSFIPNNIKKVYLGIRFTTLGTDVNRFKVDYRILFKGLPVETEFDSDPTTWKEQASGASVLIMGIRRADKNAFQDGEYDAQILVDGQVVAVLHYKIGGGEN